MHFEYEIGPDEYVASQVLYFKLSSGRKRLRGVAISILLSSLFILVAVSRGDFRWDDFFLILVAAWWFYAAFQNLFPESYYRRAYRSADLAGKKFKAEMSDEGFQVAGEDCAWRVRWPGVRWKGENGTVFLICTSGTIFMFGKKYLSDQQQQELRRLSGLVSS
ncbi:MAG TPA: hypothetical protein VMG82_23310 [Candidatus Sulfotelmatobacter sp.]|nr:hypothetical protein [Candidatus Sulfotelmatobacter sp.]